MLSALVGRDRELGVLLGCLDEAEQGRASLVVCVGGPGIGKTRLVEELTGRARERGVLTAWNPLPMLAASTGLCVVPQAPSSESGPMEASDLVEVPRGSCCPEGGGHDDCDLCSGWLARSLISQADSADWYAYRGFLAQTSQRHCRGGGFGCPARVRRLLSRRR